MRDEASASLRRFVEVIERLRAPGGCPWDRQQTHESLAPFLLEETYETLEALSGPPHALEEELGDLLLQVVLHSVIAAETRGAEGDDGDGFDIGDVAERVTAKMIHRHPHVFGDVAVGGAADVVVNWEKLKAAEKPARESLLDGIPAALPALAHAQGVQRRPARVGFDVTKDLPDTLRILREAIDAIESAATAPPPAVEASEWVATDGGFARGEGVVPGDAANAADPLMTALVGELLFAVVAVARRAGVDAEAALRARSLTFAQRFRRLEAAARAEGVDLHDIDAAQWSARWDAASVETD